MKEVITVLLIEDNLEDAQIMQEVLAKEEDAAFRLKYANRLSVALKHLAEGEVNLALLDLRLPDSHGVETLVKLRREAPKLPIVVLTASDDEALVAQALQHGAQDYIVKGYAQVYPKLLVRSMRYAIERKRAEAEVRSAHAQTEKLLASIPSILIGVNPHGRVTHWNEVAETTFGVSAVAVLNRPLADCGIQWDVQRILKGIADYRNAEVPKRLEDVTFRRPDGQQGFLGITILPIRDEVTGSDGLGYLLFGADITSNKQAEAERALLQEQLVQAQKMEMIGRFAGGIAHDFNNFLQVILGFALLIRVRRQDDKTLLSDLEEIMHAAESASGMVRQLMAFSRRQPFKPKVFEINQAVHNMERLLQQLVGERIQVVIEPSTEPLMVKLDPTGLEQIIMNFSSNARDAMPESGALTIRTARIHVDPAFVKAHSGCKDTDYVRLSIQDTGSGMDPNVAAHIFEPFFTTKPQGKGTGLGLAVVYGVVKQHDGLIDIETAIGRGTSFHVYFPCQDGAMEEGDEPTSGPAEQPAASPASTVKRHILIVDDDAAILSLCERILGQSYEVTTAGSGSEALDALARGAVDLLLTDLRMPGMDGFALLATVSKSQPGLKTLAMTGSTTIEIEQRLRASRIGCALLRKPFTPTALHEAVGRCFG